MALFSNTAGRTQASQLGTLTAALLPLLYGLARAAPYGYLAGSLTLVQDSLGPEVSTRWAPAPMLAMLCSLVPLGPLSLRIALASALCLSIVSVAIYRSIDTLLRAQGVTRDELAVPVALGMSLFACGLPALFFQALRPEAFVLQAALALHGLERLTRLEAGWPSRDLRSLYVASICFGVMLGNDLASAFFLLPATLPTLARVQQAKGYAPLGRCAIAAGCVALALHAGLPAAGGWPHPPPLAANQLRGPLSLAHAFTTELGLFVVLSALGAIAALQTPGVQRIGMLWLLACVAPLLTHGLFAAPPQARDGLGMLAFVLGASVVLGSALCGALLAPDGQPRTQVSRAQLIAVFVLLSLGALRLHATAVQTNLRQFALLDALSGSCRHQLPSRALIFSRDPATEDLLLAGEAEDRARPDVNVLSLEGWADNGAAQKAPDPELRPLLRSYLLGGELEAAELESLSARRPVVLDADPHTSPALYGSLRPTHFLYEVLGANVGRAEERFAASAYRRDVERLQVDAGTALSDESARAFMAPGAQAFALYFAARGDRESARYAIGFGRKLAAHGVDWDALSNALGPRDVTGPAASAPIDVQAYLPRDAD